MNVAAFMVQAVLIVFTSRQLHMSAGQMGLIALAGAEFVSAWSVMLFDINNNALRAAVTVDGMRGRVSGAYSTVNYGSRPVGALLGGALATVVGIPTTLVVAAAAGALAVVWIARSPIIAVRDIIALGQARTSSRTLSAPRPLSPSGSAARVDLEGFLAEFDEAVAGLGSGDDLLDQRREPR